MKKIWMILLVLAVALSMGSAVYAKDGQKGGSSSGEQKNQQDGNNEDHDGEHGNDQKDDKNSVTDSVYGKDGGKKQKREDHEEDKQNRKADRKSDQELKKAIKDILKSVDDKPTAENNEALKALVDKLKAAVNQGNSDDEDVEILADQELKGGKHEEAKNFTEKALRDNPKSEKLYKVLSKVYKEKGDTKNVKIYVNGKQPNMDVKPYFKEGRTMIPLRAISESLEAKVDWEADTRTVVISKDDIVIKLPLGSKTITVNGQEAVIEAPAELTEERTMVPVRFVSEYLKKTVDFDAETNLVIVK